MKDIAKAIAFGVELQQAGRPAEAAALYRRVLSLEPDHAGALHLLGVALCEQGRAADGLASIERAVAIEPDSPYFHNSRGNALSATGSGDSAIAAFERALELKPCFVEALVNLGNVLQDSGRVAEAIGSYSRALRLRADVPQIYNNLGNALRAAGRLEDAVCNLERALELNPGYAEAWLNLGNCRRDLGQMEAAANCYRKAVACRPRLAQGWSNLAALHIALERWNEAEKFALQALELDSECLEARINAASALIEQNRSAEARPLLEAAAAAAPSSAAVQNLAGRVLSAEKRWRDSAEAYGRAVELDPACADAWYNLGNARHQLLDLEGADQAYREALRFRPDEAKIHWNRAHTLLLAGRWLEGWPEYEWRWRRRDSPARPFSQPLWDGGDLRGRRILLHAEQGLGDTLQFARFVPAVKARGAHVMLECQPRLLPLLRSLDGVDELFAAGDCLPGFDCHLPLMSLPGVFRCTPETILPPVSYLRAGAMAACAEEVLHECRGLGVGLVWTANPASTSGARRSIPPDLLRPLGETGGVSFISLQRDDANVPEWCRRVESEESTLAETAAVIAHVDLVITVDTMIAHLAGALGVPVWVMLADVPDWRWLLSREHTPWYPTMRLFRQRSAGDWGGVVAEVRPALEKYREATKKFSRLRRSSR